MVAAQYAGNTPGEFHVDSNGCATYSIALTVPPGTGGMAPTLSLEYSSGGSSYESLIGLGWTLRGLSAITRAGATVAQDGAIGAIAYDDGDRFLLDGMRLQPVVGMYGEKSALYHTEIEMWRKVEPIYSSAVPNRNGPDSFVVWEKNGQILEYGATPDAQLLASPSNPSVRVWALNKVTDRNGNSMRIEYANDAVNSALYPIRILYTEHDGLEPQRAVTFAYEPRPDAIPHFQGGYRVTYSQRLRSISTSVSASMVKQYTLTYQQGTATGRSQLSAVTESDGEGGNLPPTTFTWLDGNAGIFADASARPVPLLQQGGGWIPCDVNGDGLVDIIYAAGAESGALQLTLLINTGSGFMASDTLTIPDLSYPGGEMLPLDMSADGRIRLVYAAEATDQSGNPQLGITVFTAYPDSASPAGYRLEAGPINGSGPQGLAPGGTLVAMDVNGDGLVDLVYTAAYDGAQLGLNVLLSDGVSFTLSSTLQTQLVFGGQSLPLDFNGDGMTDLLYAYSTGTDLEFALFRAVWGQGLVHQEESPICVTVPLTAGGALLPFDINGDGLGDFVYATQSADGSLQLYTFLSNGRAFELQNGGPQTYPLSFGGSLQPMDVNGDGLCELILASQSNDVVEMNVLQFTGTGFSIVDTNINQALGASTWGGSFVPMDLDGRGRTGMVYAYGVESVSFQVVPPAGTYPDLISTIRNGLGGEISVTHLPLTDPSVYSPTDSAAGKIDAHGLLNNFVSGSSFTLFASGGLTPGSPGATYATRSLDFPKYVVANHALRDGLGNQFLFHHCYRGAKLDLRGRGWLGYSSAESTDVDAGCVTKQVYSQEFPSVFLPLSNQLFNANGDLLQKTDTVYAAVSPTPWPEARLFIPQVQSTATEYYTPGGVEPDRQESQLFSYDDYGNRTTMTQQGSGLPAPSFIFEWYENRVDAWLLGLKIESKQCGDAEEELLFAWQKTVFDPLGQATSVSTWNDTTQAMLTTTMRYDSYGNLVSHTDPSSATTDYEFDPVYHCFRTRTTVPENDAGVRLTSLAEYDPRFGAQLSETDANGVQKQYRIDPLGRIVETLGPDPSGNLLTLTTHSWVQAAGVYHEEIRTRLNWDGTCWSWGRSYLDGMGRTYRSETLDSDGTGTIAMENAYNSRGMVYRASMPFRLPDTASLFLNYTFDALGRLTRAVIPAVDGKTLTTETDWVSFDKAIETEGVGSDEPRASIVAFGGFGDSQFVRSRTAPDGGVTTFEFDAMRRLVGVTDPEGIRTQTSYDSAARIVASSVVGKDGKIFREEVFTFDDVKRTSSVKDALGNEKTTAKDALGRALRRTVTAAGGASYSIEFKYDEDVPYGKGRQTSVTRSDGSFHYTLGYDAAGNTITLAASLYGETFVSRSQYSPIGKVEQVQLPDGAIHRSNYTPGGVLQSVQLLEDDQELLSASFRDYTPQQIPATVIYGNGVVEGSEYDTTGRLTRQTLTTTSGQVAVDTQITRDAFQEISGLIDKTPAGANQSFTYDAVGRLTSAGGPSNSEAYSYDLGGNLLSKGSVSFKYDGQQVVSGFESGETVYAATYNAMGNMTTRVQGGETQTYEYDAEERLLSDGRNRFGYDEKGSRIIKSTPDGLVTLYVSQYYEVTKFANGARQHTRTLQGAFGATATSTALDTPTQPPAVPGVPAPGNQYLHTDHLGSTRLVTDGVGVVLSEAVYEPFGMANLKETEDSFRQKFTGKELDSSGLYYFEARYYDPFTGRFIGSDDRAGASLHTSDAFNRYAYVLNNPIAFIDPTGHHWWDIVGQMIVSAVSVVVGLVLTPVSGALGGALVGAGLSGLISDVQVLATHTWNTGSSGQQWNAFGMQFGIGAATGLVTGGIGRVGSRVLSEVGGTLEGDSFWAGVYRQTGVTRAANVVSTMARRSAGKIAISAGFGALAGGSGGVLQQVLSNAAHNANPLDQAGLEHYDLTRGVGLAFMVGTLAGGLAGATSRKIIQSYGGGRWTAQQEEAFGRLPVGGAAGLRQRAGTIALGAVAVPNNATTFCQDVQLFFKVGLRVAGKSSFLAVGRISIWYATPNWPHQNW